MRGVFGEYTSDRQPFGHRDTSDQNSLPMNAVNLWIFWLASLG
jgi:hypothetical protein